MRKKIYLFLFIVLFACAGLFSGQETRGSLVIIGGALSPDNDAVYNRFIELGGGKENIRIAIIPAASGSPVKSGQSYVRDFTRYGVPESRIKIFPLAVKDDSSTKEVNEALWAGNGSDKALAREMLKYSAAFLVGGDQARYRETLMDVEGNDLPLLASIREIYHRGGVIGGTSAGAAIMSDPMIIGGNAVEAAVAGVLYQRLPSGPEPEKKAWLTKGFGFFDRGVIDQHFLKRGRTGRLIPTVLYCRKQKKHSLGFGVDEDTAIIYKDRTVEVVGRSGVLVIDTTDAVIEETAWGPRADNIILHYLGAGDSFNPETRTFHIDAARKKIKKGGEYYKKYPLDTNIFGKDAVKEIVTAGLVDNRQDRSEGLSFVLDKEGFGTGMRFIFKKAKKTVGYFGKVEGKETFTALHVVLECFPITVRAAPREK
jgi:cyanophycinase